jgi:hypothetical protein
MANTNTLAVFQNISQANPTSETAFASTAGGAVRFILTPPNVASTQLEGRLLRLRAAAKITGGTTTNYTPKLYWDSSNNTNLTTFTNDIGLAAPSAFAVNTVTRMWFLQADFVWDSTSQRLVGTFMTQIDTTFTAWAATTVGTALVNSNNIRFFLTGIFSGTNANNVAVLTDFSLDQI